MKRSASLFRAVLLLALPAAAEATAVTVSVADDAGQPLADAVVWVMVQGTRAVAAPGTGAQIQQRGRRFDPSVTVVQTGTAVTFPNFDTVRHHVYSFSPIQKFELKLYSGTPSAPVVFDRPGVATLGCNIHDRMQAWVVVVDTPHFARTDAAGVANLELPAGAHRLRAWHPMRGESGAPVEQALSVGPNPSRVAVTLPQETVPR